MCGCLLQGLGQRARETGYTAHSPSPRTTWKGTSFVQSMNVFIDSSPN